MSALTKEELVEACRVLYKLAGDNYMLPPLIRDVENSPAKSGYTYYCLAGTKCVRFGVEFDRSYVGRSQFPLRRLPLRFTCDLCDLDSQELPIDLTEQEHKALTYAFFLGAKAPIGVEMDKSARDYKLSIQLSPTFFVEWRESIDEGAAATAETICRRVGFSLYDRSRDFFGGLNAGLAIWSIRVAQELLGVPKLSPDSIWPFISLGLFLPVFDQEDAEVLHIDALTSFNPDRSTDAHGSESQAKGPLLAHAADAMAALVIPQASNYAAPIHDLRGAPALRRAVAQARRQYLRPSFAAMTLVVLAGLAMCGVNRGLPVDPTWTATNDAQWTSTIASAVASQASNENPIQSAASTNASDARQDVILTASRPLQDEASEAWPVAPDPSATLSIAEEKGRQSPKLARVPTNAAARQAAATQRSTQIARRRQRDPLTDVGRAVNQLAESLVKGLRGLPRQLSTLPRRLAGS